MARLVLALRRAGAPYRRRLVLTDEGVPGTWPRRYRTLVGWAVTYEWPEYGEPDGTISYAAATIRSSDV